MENGNRMDVSTLQEINRKEKRNKTLNKSIINKANSIKTGAFEQNFTLFSTS